MSINTYTNPHIDDVVFLSYNTSEDALHVRMEHTTAGATFSKLAETAIKGAYDLVMRLGIDKRTSLRICGSFDLKITVYAGYGMVFNVFMHLLHRGSLVKSVLLDGETCKVVHDRMLKELCSAIADINSPPMIELVESYKKEDTDNRGRTHQRIAEVSEGR